MDNEKLDLIVSKLDKLDYIEQKVNAIELHIENVTDKNIQTIAEGHLDLSRKLDNALKVENEKELLIIDPYQYCKMQSPYL